MCDPSIPLTTGEWEEWGNPNEEKYYEYMLSYGGLVHVEPLLIGRFRYISWVKCPYGVEHKASALDAGSDMPKSAYYHLVSALEIKM
jgi:hypothetical protein